MILGFALFIAGFCLLKAHKFFKHSRLIADMPTSKVRSASQGFSELIGIAKRHEYPVPSALTARECLWWSFTIERYQSSGKSSQWVVIEKGSSKRPFLLQDTTGHCVIEPEGAEISCHNKSTWYGSTRRPIGSPKKTHTSGFSVSIAGIGFGRKYRYTEKLILENDPLYALGHFETDKAGNRVARIEELSSDILRHWKQDFAALLAQYDTNNDGQLDLAEWRLVQKAAKEEALKVQKSQSGKPSEHRLTKPLHKGLPFLIGSDAQENISKRFRRKAIGFACGFLASGAYTTWIISSRLIN